MHMQFTWHRRHAEARAFLFNMGQLPGKSSAISHLHSPLPLSLRFPVKPLLPVLRAQEPAEQPAPHCRRRAAGGGRPQKVQRRSPATAAASICAAAATAELQAEAEAEQEGEAAEEADVAAAASPSPAAAADAAAEDEEEATAEEAAEPAPTRKPAAKKVAASRPRKVCLVPFCLPAWRQTRQHGLPYAGC